MTTPRFVVAAGALLGFCLGSAGLGQPPSQSGRPGAPANPAGRPTPPARPAPPPPVVSPLDPELDVVAAIESAKKEARAKGGRVLVIWAADPEAQSTRSFVEAVRTPDMMKLFGLEFAVVWAEIGTSDRGAKNVELANSLDAQLKAGDVHPTLTVLDGSGKPLGSRSAALMGDDIRRGVYSVLKIQDYLIPLRAPAPDARATMNGAVARARAGGKGVLLVFGEYGNRWAELFRGWLAQPEVARALAPSMEVANVELKRDTGAFDLMESLGGVRVQSLPWFAVLGGDGKVVGLSQTEKTPNIGFPTDDEEIGAFLGLLRKGHPGLPEGDAKAIRASLEAFRQRKVK